MTDVAAVIGNFQGAELLPECIGSLRAQSQQPVEVIVVDGSSTDDSVAVAEREGARVVRAPNNGLGFLYNRGAEAAAAAYVLFLNNDVSLDPECVAQLAGALDEDPSCFAADAQQLDWAAGRTIHARTTLTRGRLWGEYLPGLHLDPNVPADDVGTTVCANGACMLVRRDRHLELGGFDETFFMEWEDLDLCWRAWLRGWASVYVPNARLRHHVGAATTPEVQGRRTASSHHNLIRFAVKCLPWRASLVVLVGELLRWPRHPAAIGRALGRIAAESREIAQERRGIQPNRDLLNSMMRGELG